MRWPSFGPVSIAFVLLLALLLAAAVWVARRPRLGRTLWARVSDAPVVRRIWDAPVTHRVRAWSSEQVAASQWAQNRWWRAYRVTGLLLAVELAVVVALTIGFTEVLEDVLQGDGIAFIDRPVAAWLGTHRDPWLTTAMLAVTSAGSPAGLVVLGVLVSGVVALWCRSWLPIVLGLVGGIGILVVVLIAKLLVVRGRPPIPFAVVTETGYSFPSGHAAGTAVVGLLSAWMLTRYLITWWTPQVMVWTLAVGLIGVVGLSRVYLGVHYVSDVVAGWLLGAAWVGGVILVGRLWDIARRVRASESQTR